MSFHSGYLTSYNITTFGKTYALISNPKPLLSKAKYFKFELQPF
jgi:hypothetical protein